MHKYRCAFPLSLSFPQKVASAHTILAFLWIMYLKDPSLSGRRELHHSSLHCTVLQCMGELPFNQSPTDGCLGCSSLIFKMLGLFFLSFKTTKQTKQPLGWIMGTLNASGGKCWAAPRPEFTARMLACTLQKPWLLGCQWERKSLGEQLQVSPVQSFFASEVVKSPSPKVTKPWCRIDARAGWRGGLPNLRS